MGAEESASHVLTCDISGDMEVGKIIPIKARVSPNPARFAVNLKCSNGDIAFHFNPRFNEKQDVVVCNTYTVKENQWDTEERNPQMPFRPGESFEMTITTQNSCYEVSVNGKSFLTYNHRVPFHTVKQLEFYGDIKFEESGSPSKPDSPPFSPFTQADSPSGGNGDPETPKRLKRRDSDKTSQTEIQFDFKDKHESDPQAEGCCFCKFFVRPQWIQCTRWKVGGAANFQIHEIRE